MKYYLVIIILCLGSLLSALTIAEKREKTVKMVKNGIEMYLEKGEKVTFEAINDTTDKKFHDGEFYLFAFDFDFVCRAHGQIKEIIGKSVKNLKDARGIFFARNFVKTAASKEGKGWVTYVGRWGEENSKDKKIVYVERIPNTFLFIGSGFYE